MGESEYYQSVSRGGMLTLFLIINILVMWGYVIFLHWQQNKERSKLIDRLMIKEHKTTFNPDISPVKQGIVSRQLTDEELYYLEQAEIKKNLEKQGK